MTDDEASFIVAGVEDRAEAPDVLAELGCVRPPHLGDAERSSHPINLCQVLAGQDVGGKQVSDRIWLVTSWTAISAPSTLRRVGSSRSRTRSARKCYLCLQE